MKRLPHLRASCVETMSLVFVVILALPARSWAQHGNYLLGSLGLLGAPEGQVFLFGWAALFDPFK